MTTLNRNIALTRHSPHGYALATLALACAASSAMAEQARLFDNPPDLEQSVTTRLESDSTLLTPLKGPKSATRQPEQRTGKER